MRLCCRPHVSRRYSLALTGCARSRGWNHFLAADHFLAQHRPSQSSGRPRVRGTHPLKSSPRVQLGFNPPRFLFKALWAESSQGEGASLRPAAGDTLPRPSSSGSATARGHPQPVDIHSSIVFIAKKTKTKTSMTRHANTHNMKQQ